MVGKKKRNHPDVEDLLARPWCYYCERDFDDLKILISHQKAKHFKCERCGRRLNTAGGLSVHMNQVHKETLSSVDNSLPNRQGLEVEIFGMEGIPEDVSQAHNQRIIAGYYQAEAERRVATGNPGPGGGNVASGNQLKKPKFESPADLKKRLAEHKAKKAEQAATGAGTSSGGNTPLDTIGSPMGQSPGTYNGSPYAPPQAPYGASPGSFSQESYQQPVAAYQQSFNNQQAPFSGASGSQYQPQYSPPQQYPTQQSFPPPGYQQSQQNFQGGAPQYGAGSPPGSFNSFQGHPSHSPPGPNGLPNRPPSLPPAPGLPQRPAFGASGVPPYQMQQMHQGAPGQGPPPQGGWAGNGWNGQNQNSAMSSAYPHSTNAAVDDLISGAAREADDIDKIIRMAEQGIKPPKKGETPSSATLFKAEEQAANPISEPAKIEPHVKADPAEKTEPTEKKTKKDKPMKMIYSDNEVSPEEKMSKMPRYAFVPDGKTETALVDATTVPGVAATVDV